MKKTVCLFLFIVGIVLFISGVCCIFHWWINLLFFCFSPWLWLPQIILWVSVWQKYEKTNSWLLNFTITESIVFAGSLMLMPAFVLVFNFNFIISLLPQILLLIITILLWIFVILEKIVKLTAARLSKKR